MVCAMRKSSGTVAGIEWCHLSPSHRNLIPLVITLQGIDIMLWSESVCPSLSLYVKILTPNMKVLGGGAFGRRVGHEGGTLVSGISAPITETPNSSLTPPAV